MRRTVRRLFILKFMCAQLLWLAPFECCVFILFVVYSFRFFLFFITMKLGFRQPVMNRIRPKKAHPQHFFIIAAIKWQMISSKKKIFSFSVFQAQTHTKSNRLRIKLEIGKVLRYDKWQFFNLKKKRDWEGQEKINAQTGQNQVSQPF